MNTSRHIIASFFLAFWGSQFVWAEETKHLTSGQLAPANEYLVIYSTEKSISVGKTLFSGEEITFSGESSVVIIDSNYKRFVLDRKNNVVAIKPTYNGKLNYDDVVDALPSLMHKPKRKPVVSATRSDDQHKQLCPQAKTLKSLHEILSTHKLGCVSAARDAFLNFSTP